ncbi:MAG: PLP-dependent aminotransferase family protein [Desulfobacterales bacterium]|nr:PLP-dependent aminotransferase family protein [Desulfobacterales bacterium]
MASGKGAQKSNFHYVILANKFEDKILSGSYQIGERLPSIRELHNSMGLSISTIYQTYIELEKRELIEAQPRSGYYVKKIKHLEVPKPQVKSIMCKTRRYSTGDLTAEIVKTIQDRDFLQLGCTVISPELLPLKQFNRAIREISKFDMEAIVSYANSDGDFKLKRELAKRMTLNKSGYVDENEIVITNGCMEALSLCLRTVTKPGDTIIVESPTFFNLLQLIQNLGLYVVEIPTCPQDGINLQALENVVKSNQIKACVIISNFQNPLGCVIPDEKKAQLVEFMNRQDIPIIEDDIYGDLYFEDPRPSTLKSFDKKGLVLYCSSFSKTLSPGMRIGWTMAGRFTERIKRLKLNSTLASPLITQLIIADFLLNGSYERHLRRLRNALKNQMSLSRAAISEFFPEQTRVTSPKGGFMLWIELPDNMNSVEIFYKARKRKISIVPGLICSSSGEYKNCLRISCGIPWSGNVRKGFSVLGSIVNKSLPVDQSR